MYIEGLNLQSTVTLTISSGNYLVLTMNVARTLFVSPIPVATIPPMTPTPHPNFTLPTPPPPQAPSPCPTPVITPTPTSYVSGLIANYYDNMNWTNPVFYEIVNQIMFADHESVSSSPWITTIDPTYPGRQVSRDENFSASFDGYIYVPTTDAYTFYLASDDGSYLHLDGLIVIDNGGYHEYTEKTWSEMLSAGYHPIKVFMFQSTNKSVIHLQYTTTLSAIKQPVTDLWHIP
ncbi:MAG TPA: PA14 domain-containing protein [Methanocella sp.]